MDSCPYFRIVKHYVFLLVHSKPNILTMDNKERSENQDMNRININEKYELQYWSKKLRVSQDELIKAVKSAGTTLYEVKRYLKQD